MKNKLILLTIIFSFLFISHQSIASTTDGTISPTYRYAWGENIGFVDFGSTSGDIHITDSSLSGYAYGENIGFINLSTITNNNEGTLSGYAWGENVGWIDFSQVSINTNGIFTGQAYGENIGFITFNTNDNNKVTTDWRPRSTRSTGGGGGGGGGNPPPTPVYCPAGVLFDSVTGKKCTAVAPTTNDCPLGAIFNPQTGAKCSSTTTTEVYCNQGHLFDTLTGKACTKYYTNNSQNPTTFLLTKTLKLGMTDNEVKTLQVYLNTHGYIVATVGNGSPNNETTYFGERTKQAVIKFQLANNLKGDGVVGPITRSLLK